MTNQPDDATKSWLLCRKTFANRTIHYPEVELVIPLIDWIIDRGLAASIYASTSLDNLVVSNAPNWRDRSRHLLVMPKKDSIEMRYSREGALVERIEVNPDRLQEEFNHLLRRLLQDN